MRIDRASEHEDRALVRRLLDGDGRAFDEFFEDYAPALYRFAMARTSHDADAAEEVVQATLCRAVAKLATYRGEAALFTWLCTFCRHEISAYYRRANRQPPTVDLLEDGPEVAGALESLWARTGEDPEHALRRSEAARLVHVALDRLPARYARALEWKYIDGLAVRQIADRLRVSPKAAESLLTRAREAMRDAIAALTRARRRGGNPGSLLDGAMTHDADRRPNSAPDVTDERLERLLRATGRRPALPPERARRIRSGVRERWRAELASRARGRRARRVAAFATAASILVVAGGVLWRGAGTPPGDAVARVEVVAGTVETAGGARLTGGERIEIGSELVTGEDGRVALRLASGHSVRLDAGTTLRLVEGRVAELEAGAVYVDSRGPASEATRPLEIRTAFGTVTDVGTQFEVRLSGSSLRLRVREGRVALEGEAGRAELRAGHQLEVDGSGAIVRSNLAPGARAWAWLGAVTPMMDLEGRTLREFLDWVARERGLRLRFARVDLAASSSGIVLNGSIEEMTIEQALESVLPTCGLRHRIDGDSLVVEELSAVPPG